MRHKKFHEILVQELIIHSQGKTVTASSISWGRPSSTTSQLSGLEVKDSQHWPSKGKPWAVSHVIAAQENKEHTVFLQEV